MAITVILTIKQVCRAMRSFLHWEDLFIVYVYEFIDSRYLIFYVDNYYYNRRQQIFHCNFLHILCIVIVLKLMLSFYQKYLFVSIRSFNSKILFKGECASVNNIFVVVVWTPSIKPQKNTDPTFFSEIYTKIYYQCTYFFGNCLQNRFYFRRNPRFREKLQCSHVKNHNQGTLWMA